MQDFDQQRNRQDADLTRMGIDQTQQRRAWHWQNPEQDRPTRQGMITKIHNLLRVKKPDADDEWLRKLPDMAKRLEDKLYRHAVSLKYGNRI